MMSKKRIDPIGNAREALNKKTDNCAEKNKKHLKYTLSLLFGIILGILLGAILKLC
nr:MAG TPA: hypothetical protein [Caudoviricetes sp.]